MGAAHGDDDVAALLRSHWAMPAAVVRPLAGGMNSDSWLVEHDATTYVAKRVPPDGIEDLCAGAEVATALAAAGLVTGAPVPTSDGTLTLAEHGLVLLEHVPGRELEGEREDEQRWMAATLARVHLVSDPGPGPSPATFMTQWLSPDLPGVADHTWLLNAMRAVRAETDALALTWSTVHTDPAPEAFVHDDTTGVTGLIDWAGARRGPVLYDVASAVMYLGGPAHAGAFLDAYGRLGPLDAAELRHLDAFRRLREAVQGAYFARRLAGDDRTGGVERADNEKGLEDARRRLAALGLGSR